MGSLIASFVNEAGTQLEFNCPCFVQMGAYKSVDECMMWQGARPDWVPCSTDALTKFDTPETREVFRCLSNMVRDSTACLRSKPCDAVARAECGTSRLQCLAAHVDLGFELLKECPDIALLTRQQ